MSDLGRSYDWVWSAESNVSVAKDRAWFTSYTPFESYVLCFPNDLSGDPISKQVIGVGTVRIEVKTSWKRSGQKGHKVLLVKHVLHVPTAPFNILGALAIPKLSVELDDVARLCSEDGHCVALLKVHPVVRLVLRGRPKPNIFRGGSACDIHYSWPHSEKARWDLPMDERASATKIESPRVFMTGLAISMQAGRTGVEQAVHPDATIGTGIGMQVQDPSQNDDCIAEQPYTAREKNWLKRNYGGEFHFLTIHGLSIYDDDDREEGRVIARSFMHNDEEEHSASSDLEPNDNSEIHLDDEIDKASGGRDGNEDEPTEEEEHAYDELEDDEDGCSMLAKSYFDGAQREWLVKHYGSPLHFLLCFGLKFYDMDDCEEGVAIVRSFMDEDEDE